MSRVYFKNGKNYHIKNNDYVKVLEYSNKKELKIKNSSNHNNHLKNFVKLSKEEYLNKETGEILKYTLNVKRSKRGIKNSMKKLNELLKNNFNGDKNEAFLTLTYEEAESDFDNAVEDMEEFWKKLKNEFEDLEFIAVIEEQKRKSWHIHMLLKNIGHKSIFIPEEEIKRLWNKGNISISKISKRGIKKAFYEEEMTEDADDEDDTEEPIERVIGYMCKLESKENTPKGKKMYYKSRGIKFPKESKMKYEEALKLIDKWYLYYEKTVLVVSIKTDNIVNKIKLEIYRSPE